MISRPDASQLVESDQMTLLKFIEQGRKWAELENVPSLDINALKESNGYHKVTGCLATIKLKVTYIASTGKIKVHGVADSYVTLGMLAVIAKVYC